jgi:hypothetical protein
MSWALVTYIGPSGPRKAKIETRQSTRRRSKGKPAQKEVIEYGRNERSDMSFGPSLRVKGCGAPTTPPAAASAAALTSASNRATAHWHRGAWRFLGDFGVIFISHSP